MPAAHLRTLGVLPVLLTVATAACAQADAWPQKPVRWISPFPPGGAVDVVARMTSAKLTEMLGQQVVVDNRSGASGNIGTELAMRAAPDGYTLVSHTLPFVVNPALFGKVPYDAQRDFEPVTLIAAQSSFLGVHPSVPARNVKELIALARAKPGMLNYGTAGAGTNPHVAGEFFNLLAKVDIVPVHFKGGGPALIATMGGEVGLTYLAIVGATSYIQSGRVRALAVTGSKRAATMPNVPTIAESGVPGYEFQSWHILLAPRGTPRPLVNLVSDKVRAALRTPDLAARFRQDELDIIASSPEECATFIAGELKKWARVVKERGMKPE